MLNVLVVDDDDADRKMVKRLVRQTGLDLRVFETGHADGALAFDQVVPDAVFLDYLLPGRDGLGLLEELRARWPAVAVVLMTGQGDEELAKSAIMKGAADYIAKRAISSGVLIRILETGVPSARMRWQIEEQRRELETFSHVLVHDLKAPIRSIDWLSGQIEADINANDYDEVRDGLRLLRRNVRQMGELIDSLSDHIRLDRDHAMVRFPIADLYERAVAAIEREISENGAKFRFESEAREMVCSPPQISQLLQNLLSNAIKYRGESPPLVDVRVVEQGTMLLFSVADNGVGVPAEYLTRIFEPFKRVRRDRGPAGTGLGLATCRKIVERHGGVIWCESREGEGSTIYFKIDKRLPVSEA